MNATEQLISWIRESEKIVFLEGQELRRKAEFPTFAPLQAYIRRNSTPHIRRRSC